MANNVLIKTRTASKDVDAFNRTAVCASAINNGCVFKLDSYSVTEGEKYVWTATQAAATDTGLWMASSPEVVVTNVMTGIDFKGIVVDPRAFTNQAGAMIDCFKLQVGDTIELYSETIADIGTKNYLIPATTGFALVAADAAGTGLTLKKVGTGVLHIGQPSIAKSVYTTYKYVVEIN